MKHIAFFLVLLIPISILHAQDTINVEAGWNMVGDISKWHIDQIRSEPPGIISSSFYDYSSIGYTAKDTLNKGKGYWVKTSQAGILIWEIPAGFLCGTSSVTYADKIYHTVQIGSQCWFKENLNIGSMIQGVDTATNNATIEKYCYNNDSGNCNTYGAFYQWNEAMEYSTTSGTQGICPTGWHIPTLAQLNELGTAVSGNGDALKAVGQGTGVGAGTDSSGFSAMLSGGRGINNVTFLDLASYAYFWSSTEREITNTYGRYLYYNDSGIYSFYLSKASGLSVRCLKD